MMLFAKIRLPVVNPISAKLYSPEFAFPFRIKALDGTAELSKFVPSAVHPRDNYLRCPLLAVWNWARANSNRVLFYG